MGSSFHSPLPMNPVIKRKEICKHKDVVVPGGDKIKRGDTFVQVIAVCRCDLMKTVIKVPSTIRVGYVT